MQYKFTVFTRNWLTVAGVTNQRFSTISAMVSWLNANVEADTFSINTETNALQFASPISNQYYASIDCIEWDTFTCDDVLDCIQNNDEVRQAVIDLIAWTDNLIIAVTWTPAGILTTQAQLNGVINWNGNTVSEKWFVWYLSGNSWKQIWDAWVTKVAHASVWADWANYSDTITWLTTWTEYCFRAYAINSDTLTTYYGAEVCFTTA